MRYGCMHCYHGTADAGTAGFFEYGQDGYVVNNHLTGNHA